MKLWRNKFQVALATIHGPSQMWEMLPQSPHHTLDPIPLHILHPHILTPSHLHTLTSSHTHTITGILCGECRQSYGVGMLVMRCREFNARFPMYYWLLPLLGMWKLGAWPHYHRYYIPVEDGHVHTAGSSPSWVWRGVARGQITHRYIDDGICCDNYDNRIDWLSVTSRLASA